MSQRRLNDHEARQALKEGIDEVANPVKITLGPKGKNVVIDHHYGPQRVTKDGVTVAKSISVDDPVINAGAKMIRTVASQTADDAGDGTTTATLLAQHIMHGGLKLLAAGCNPRDIKRGMDKAVQFIVTNLKEMAKQVRHTDKEIERIAIVSANNDEEIGKLIAGLIRKIGKEGKITVETSKNTETTSRTVDGYSFERGLISPYFVDQGSQQMIVELENPYIMIVDKKFTEMRPLIKICEQVMLSGKTCLMIADDVTGSAIAGLAINKAKGIVSIVPVRAPAMGKLKNDLLNDIAVLTGGTVVTENSGVNMDNLNIGHMGKAGKVIITKDSTIILDPQGKKEQIELAAQRLRDNGDAWSMERLAMLKNGIAVISVGAPTEIEINEKKDRIDDAIRACEAAQQEGVVPGGGTALIRAAALLTKAVKASNPDEASGIKLIALAAEAPLTQMCINGGEDYATIVSQVKNAKDIRMGYNGKKEKVENLVAAGIIDPAKVVRVAMENAVSVASMVLISQCLIVDYEREEGKS